MREDLSCRTTVEPSTRTLNLPCEIIMALASPLLPSGTSRTSTPPSSSSAYEQRRTTVLSGLYGSAMVPGFKPDRSLKTGVDAKFNAIVNTINERPFWYTTSCCSGRLSVFIDQAGSNLMKTKKRGFLSVAAHEEESFPTAAELIERVNLGLHCYEKSLEKERNEVLPQTLALENVTATLRFEPLLLHVKCETLEAAQMLLKAAREAGLKENGVTGWNASGFDVRICGSLRMAVPLKIEGEWVVEGEAALEKLIERARHMMRRNDERLGILLQKIE